MGNWYIIHNFLLLLSCFFTKKNYKLNLSLFSVSEEADEDGCSQWKGSLQR